MTSIHLLNHFAVLVGDEPVMKFRSDKARALLAYVATQPQQMHNRSSLAALLWSDLPEKTAKTNLRIVLSNLRKIVPDALSIDRKTVSLADNVEVDVVALRSAISAENYPAAVNLYQGEFLHEFMLNDTQPFEEWMLIEREALHIDMMRLLDRWLTQLTEDEAWSQAISVGQRQLRLQRWHEPAHQRLMRAFAAQGEMQKVNAQFARCRETLQEELGAEPSAATVALYGQLSKQAEPTHNLPTNLSTFVGRSQDIAAIHDAVLTHRLVTVLGMGGVGKTRIGIRAAETLLGEFEGVYFVPLVGVISAEAVAMAILSHTGHEQLGVQSPIEQMIAQLHNKRLLLLLDNMDQLVDLSADFLLPLLEQTSVHLLLTSRAGTRLSSEHVVRISGLPTDKAVDLFLKRAPVKISNRRAVQRICDGVAGLPLGIELAAHWTEHFSVSELADKLAQDATFLQKDAAEGRHSSLRAVYAHSWAYLSKQERTVLAQLSVFRGGFGRKAVLEITDASLSHMTQLINKSLVQRVAAGRYQLHEVVREFSAEKLSPSDPTPANHSAFYLASDKNSISKEDIDNVRTAWQWLIKQGASQKLHEHRTTFQTLMFQHGLLHEALNLIEDAEQVAIDQNDPNTQAGLLWIQHDILRRIEGKVAAIDVLEKARHLATDPQILASIHGDLANELVEVGRWAEGEPHFLEQERLARQTGKPRAIVTALLNHAMTQTLQFVGDFPAAIARLNEALALAKAELPEHDQTYLKIRHGLMTSYMRYGDYANGILVSKEQIADLEKIASTTEMIDALIGSGLLFDFAGLHAQAIQHEQRGLTLSREASDWEAIGLLQTNLSMAYRHSGELETAREYGAAAIKLLDELGISRMLGMAQNRHAHTLLALGNVEAAHAMYRAAEETWRPLEHPNIHEAWAGLAATNAHQGALKQAKVLAEKVLAFASADKLHRVVEPILMLAHCAEAFAMLENPMSVQQAQQLGETWIETISKRIEDDNVRDAYQNNIRAHHRLRSIYI